MRVPALLHRNARLARREWTHSLHHRGDVLRHSSAAAAHDLRSSLHEVVRVSGHVLGARHVHASPAHIAWHSCVWLGAQLSARHRYHLLDRVENYLRSDGAVEADYVGAEGIQRLREIFDR